MSKSLPPVTVDDDAYSILKSYAHHKEISMGEAIRQLLKTSQELNDFAKERGREIGFNVNSWGGKRG